MLSAFWFQDVRTSVSNTDYNAGGTNTASALRFARLQAFTRDKGMRSHAAQVAIVITDGGSNEGGDPALEAEKLRGKVREGFTTKAVTSEND